MNEDQALRTTGQIILNASEFHEQAWDKLDRMEEAARSLADKKTADVSGALKRMEEVARFLGNDLEPHFRLEEDKVFPLMKSLLPPRGRSGLAARVKEHEAIRTRATELTQLIHSARQDQAGTSPEQVLQIRSLSIQIVRMTRTHITKEDLINRVIFSLTPRAQMKR